MLPWKNICGIWPKSLPSRLLIVRKSSAFPVVFRKEEFAWHGIGREDPLQFRLLECRQKCRPSFGQPLRFLSEKAPRDQKESSVLRDLVESHEQPQTQLTVGAKGLSSIFSLKSNSRATVSPQRYPRDTRGVPLFI